MAKCNSKFFSGDIDYQKLGRNENQIHRMNCAFKYFSAKNVFILVQEFHKWGSQKLNSYIIIMVYDHDHDHRLGYNLDQDLGLDFQKRTS